MRTIDVTIHCDWPGCDFAVSETASVGLIFERPIAIDGKAEKTFALCKVDNDKFDEVLAPLLAKALKSEARNPRPKKPSSAGGAAADGSSANVSAETECLVPGCSSPPLKSRAGLGQHVIRTHGYKSLADYDTEYINPATGAPTTSG